VFRPLKLPRRTERRLAKICPHCDERHTALERLVLNVARKHKGNRRDGSTDIRIPARSGQAPGTDCRSDNRQSQAASGRADSRERAACGRFATGRTPGRFRSSSLAEVVAPTRRNPPSAFRQDLLGLLDRPLDARMILVRQRLHVGQEGPFLHRRPRRWRIDKVCGWQGYLSRIRFKLLLAGGVESRDHPVGIRSIMRGQASASTAASTQHHPVPDCAARYAGRRT
jgi:hypothetical protein